MYIGYSFHHLGGRVCRAANPIKCTYLAVKYNCRKSTIIYGVKEVACCLKA